MMDNFKHLASGLESPAQNASEITPNDGQNLTNATRALWVGVMGDLNVITISGDNVTFKNASGWMPVRVKQVKQTGTSASNIIGVW